MNVSGVNPFDTKAVKIAEDEKGKEQNQEIEEEKENKDLLDKNEFDTIELEQDETEAKKVAQRSELNTPGCYYIEEANYGGEPCYYLSFMDLDGSKSTDNLFESMDQILYFLQEQGFAVAE